MSTSFQSCPKCESFILSDTYECPECGHIFDQERADASRTANVDDMQMYDTCRDCGESVRTGLVRCWNCNAFMRRDVEERYKQMSSTPQAIIFSDIPKDQRTEFVPARDSQDRPGPGRVFDADSDGGGDTTGFSLRSDQSSQDEDEFELDAGPETAAAAPPPSQPAPAAPGTEKQDPATADAPASDAAESQKPSDRPAEKKQDSTRSPDDFDVDDLVGIALQDQKETRRRKREKLQEAKRRRILMPCACGAWIRVHQDQAGRTVRCKQCKSPVVVPVMKQRRKDAERKTEAPQIKVNWVDAVRMHVIQPTDVTLKPGSLEKTFELVDLGFHSTGMHVVQPAPPAKKSFFSKSTDGPPSVEEQRTAVRNHITKTGKISNLPFGELNTVAAEQIPTIRLIQPVKEAHASMFAGVPVFGEGQIAVYLPFALPEGKQAFLSFPLSVHRRIAKHLKSLFNFSYDAEQNGVPPEEKINTLRCQLSDMPVKALQNVEYYQHDPAFELQLSGHICETCGAAVTEEARARKKLGGASGKGIAKAKCPKCSNKFGDQKAWDIAKAPEESAAEEDEDVTEVLKPKTVPAAGDVPAELQGRWKMLSLAEPGRFDSPEDVSAADIVFTIDGAAYTVAAGGTVQEQGRLVVDGKQAPSHLDQEVTDGPDAGRKHLGLYRLVDGRLQNCQGAFDQPRPQSFEQPGDSASLATFEKLS